MGYEKEIADRLTSKFWDFPTQIDEMRIITYDANDNPTVIDYYFTGRIRFRHEMTYDVDGRLTIKKLIRFE